ncbi:MAG: serine/threonine-protein kinase [Myxococcota bacterium]
MASPERIGSFDVVRRVGAGGMGEIFLGRRPEDGEYVAIKRLIRQASKDPVFVGMFLDEGRLAARLTHPKIVRLFELGESPEGHYLAIEWVDGGSLRELLERSKPKGPLPVDLIVRIGVDVAEALAYAHVLRDERDTPLEIVHRDVSPANVMVSFAGQAKLLDFGLAKARDQLQKTQPGMVKGKFGYLAPEQLAGTSDGRTDLFALGLVLWELLAGRKYFDHETAAATVAAVRQHAACASIRTLRPDVPAALDQLLQRVTAADPKRRPANAGAFREALLRATPAATPEALGEHVKATFPDRMEEVNRGSFVDMDGSSDFPGLRTTEIEAQRARGVPWVAVALGALAIGGAVAFAVFGS